MMDELSLDLSPSQRHFQGILNQVAARPSASWTKPTILRAVSIQYHRQMEPPCCGADLYDVCQPLHDYCPWQRNLPLQQIRRRR